MNKYPYIGKGRLGDNVTLFLGEREGIVIKNIILNFGQHKKDWVEGSFENATTEYLVNTYGKVESPEHGKLVNALLGFIDPINNDYGTSLHYFIIDSNLNISFSSGLFNGDTDGKREITIPMPPKSSYEDEFKHFESEMNNCASVSLAKIDIEWQPEPGKKAITQDGSVCTIKSIEGNLASCEFWCKFDEDKIMINVHVDNLKEFKEVDKMKDWPQVGDEVVFTELLQHYDEYKEDYCNKVSKVIARINTEQGEFITVHREYCAVMTVRIDRVLEDGALIKPKTEDEILRDLLKLLWRENNEDFDMFLDIVTEHITKKGG